jgi:DNA-directed RNA polymerase subunit M/transcription elongation factor TFIIS
MSKNRNRNEQINEVAEEPAAAVPAAELRRVVETHRQCPVCHHGELNGVGTATSTQGSKRYYKCDRCGHGWTATINPSRVVQVEHREVNINTRS